MELCVAGPKLPIAGISGQCLAEDLPGIRDSTLPLQAVYSSNERFPRIYRRGARWGINRLGGQLGDLVTPGKHEARRETERTTHWHTLWVDVRGIATADCIDCDQPRRAPSTAESAGTIRPLRRSWENASLLRGTKPVRLAAANRWQNCDARHLPRPEQRPSDGGVLARELRRIGGPGLAYHHGCDRFATITGNRLITPR